jgi:hypothetical protein
MDYNLTDLEKQAMKVIDDEYCEDLTGEYGVTWSFAWMEQTGIPEKQLRGVMSSLIQKGLIIICGKGNDAELSYTKEGIKVCKSLQ